MKSSRLMDDGRKRSSNRYTGIVMPEIVTIFCGKSSIEEKPFENRG